MVFEILSPAGGCTALMVLTELLRSSYSRNKSVVCKELIRFSYATTIYFDIRSTRESPGVGEDAYRGPRGEL